jgi:hypothetical protein
MLKNPSWFSVVAGRKFRLSRAGYCLGNTNMLLGAVFPHWLPGRVTRTPIAVRPDQTVCGATNFHKPTLLTMRRFAASEMGARTDTRMIGTQRSADDWFRRYLAVGAASGEEQLSTHFGHYPPPARRFREGRKAQFVLAPSNAARRQERM